MTETKNADSISERACDLYYKISRDGIAGDVVKAELRALHSDARNRHQKDEIESAIRLADKYYGHRWWKPWRSPEKDKYRLLGRLSRTRWFHD